MQAKDFVLKEGFAMTEPSYEELEQERDTFERRYKAAERDAEAAETSLARVRGLLQRQWILLNDQRPDEDTDVLACSEEGQCCVVRYNFDPSEGVDWWSDGTRHYLVNMFTHWRPLPAPPTFQQSSSLVSQGAESADIGKPPDTVAGDFELDFLKTCGIKDHVIREGDRNTQLMLSELLSAYKFVLQPSNYEAGSAETGGEKAGKRAYFEAQARKKGGLYMGSNYLIAKDGSVWDCIMWAGGGIANIHQYVPGHPDFPATYRAAVLREDTVFEERATFPRSSQNQTVSSGVEGAHEGTTADKNEYDESTDFCAKLMATSLAPTRTPQLRDSREPEKLNTAQKAKLKFDGIWNQPPALAESSLSQITACTATVHTDDCKKTGECDRASSPELLPTQLPKADF